MTKQSFQFLACVFVVLANIYTFTMLSASSGEQRQIRQTVVNDPLLEKSFASYNFEVSTMLKAMYVQKGLLVVPEKLKSWDLVNRIVNMAVIESGQRTLLDTYQTDHPFMRQALGLIKRHLRINYTGEDNLESINEFAIPIIDANLNWYIGIRTNNSEPTNAEIPKRQFILDFLNLKDQRNKNNKEERKMLFRAWLSDNHQRIVILKDVYEDYFLDDLWDELFGDVDNYTKEQYLQAIPRIVQVAPDYCVPAFNAIYNFYSITWKNETERLLTEFGIAKGPVFDKIQSVSDQLYTFLNMGFETATSQDNKKLRFWTTDTQSLESSATFEKALDAYQKYRTYTEKGLVGTKSVEQVRNDVIRENKDSTYLIGPRGKTHFSDIFGSSALDLTTLEANALTFNSKGRVSVESWLSKMNLFYKKGFPKSPNRRANGTKFSRVDGVKSAELRLAKGKLSRAWFEDFNINYAFEFISTNTYSYGSDGLINRIIYTEDNWDFEKSDPDWNYISKRTPAAVKGETGSKYLDLKLKNGLLDGVITFYPDYIESYGASALSDVFGLPHPVWWQQDGGYDNALDGNSTVHKMEVSFKQGLPNGKLKVYRRLEKDNKIYVATFEYKEGIRLPKPGHWSSSSE